MIAASEIHKARNADLFEILSRRGYSLAKEGNDFRVNGNAGLIIQGSKWFHHSKNCGGNTIDFMMTLENMTFLQAVREINQCSRNHIKNLTFDQKTDHVENYLVRQRMVDRQLVEDLICLKIIQQFQNNRACFIGFEKPSNFDDFGSIKCVSWRSLNGHCKGEFKGSNKNYSFVLPDYSWIRNHDSANSRTVILAESPIDVLSIACLEHLKHHKGYFQTYKIALCGSNHQNLIQRIEPLKPDKILIAMDNDQVGKQAAMKIKKELMQIVQIIKIIQFPDKDPNDLLIRIKKRA